MNRRNFFKAVTGFVVGVFALPKKAKPQLTVAMLRDVADKLPKQKAGKIFWMPVKNKNADRKWVRNPDYDDGLKEAFCYGGKLFRVFRGYMREKFTMIQLREGQWTNCRLLLNSDFENLQYRHWACESMLRKLERKLKEDILGITWLKEKELLGKHNEQT